MKKIVTLTGHKYCGKVSVAVKLASNSDMDLVYPVTDKPVPVEQSEYNRDEYAHVTRERMDELIEKEHLLSETVIDGYRYCFFEFQLKSPFNIMILDDDGVVQTKRNYTGDVFTIKVWSDRQAKSERVGEYMTNDEFDVVFHYKVDDISELEWRIGYDFD